MKVALSEKCFADFLVLIHQLTGITIAHNRTFMVEGRLRKRLKDLNLPSYETYLELVRGNKAEQEHFVDLITTNETTFYRTPRIWEFLENKFLPKWFAENQQRRVFTAWSAAASSGEEAHTLAILCQSYKEKNPSFSYQIIGSDISNEMVELCRAGEYFGRSIDAFLKARPELFNRFMQPSAGGKYKAMAEIRARMRFHQHNLFHVFAQGKDRFDLILLRNVLIYFKREDQEKVVSTAATRLMDRGVLIIGESESLSHINTPFKFVEPLIYQFDSSQSSLVKAG